MKSITKAILDLITTAVASWIVNCGLIYLAAWCLEIPMTLRLATGIWLVQALIRSTLSSLRKDKK